ncbi:MAG: putative lipid II flippase FtsW [Lentisphaerae bacterium]|nr:putative lipid II flippase FtsW [Lentisphaerota bacterium]
MWKTPTVLILLVLFLLALGIVMLASTSGIRAAELYDDPNYFVKRQALWLVIAGCAGFLAGRLNYHRWRPLALACFVVSVGLLALVLVPGIGAKIGGSRRWFHVGAFLSFQPSELAKFALVLVLAWWLAREKWCVREFWRGAAIPLMMLGLLALLIFVEPDFGTTVLCGAVGLGLLYAGGTRVAYLAVSAVIGFSAFVVAVLHDPVRLNRIMAFLNPEQYAQTYSFQLLSAINAFIAGGPFGVGLGRSIQKRYYLPEAHTDFIFAIIGEELGVVASLAVVLMFAGLFICGLRISLRAPDMFGRLLAFGITLMIALQAVINISVVIGLLPTKGLPLPFISAGGSSLVVTMLEVGVLYNIARQARPPVSASGSKAIGDRVHQF